MDLIWEFDSKYCHERWNILLHHVLRNILVLSLLKCSHIEEVIINTVLVGFAQSDPEAEMNCE